MLYEQRSGNKATASKQTAVQKERSKRVDEALVDCHEKDGLEPQPDLRAVGQRHKEASAGWIHRVGNLIQRTAQVVSVNKAESHGNGDEEQAHEPLLGLAPRLCTKLDHALERSLQEAAEPDLLVDGDENPQA